jgi:hypothetical protein
VGAKCGDVRPLHQGHLSKLQNKPVDKKTGTDQDLAEDLEVLELEETKEDQEGVETKETSDEDSEYSAMHWCFGFHSALTKHNHAAWALMNHNQTHNK